MNLDIFQFINKLHGLWNPEVQCRIHKGSLIIPILSRINPIPCIDTYLFKVHSNIVLPSTPRLPQRSFQVINPVPRPCVTFLKEDDFYSVRLLSSSQSPQLEDHSWSTDHDCLFNIFAAMFHIWRPTPPFAT